jgi:hypothetical protein
VHAAAHTAISSSPRTWAPSSQLETFEGNLRPSDFYTARETPPDCGML